MDRQHPVEPMHIRSHAAKQANDGVAGWRRDALTSKTESDRPVWR